MKSINRKEHKAHLRWNDTVGKKGAKFAKEKIRIYIDYRL
jgi:hypothetical protein